MKGGILVVRYYDTFKKTSLNDFKIWKKPKSTTSSLIYKKKEL